MAGGCRGSTPRLNHSTAEEGSFGSPCVPNLYHRPSFFARGVARLRLPPYLVSAFLFELLRPRAGLPPPTRRSVFTIEEMDWKLRPILSLVCGELLFVTATR